MIKLIHFTNIGQSAVDQSLFSDHVLTDLEYNNEQQHY